MRLIGLITVEKGKVYVSADILRFILPHSEAYSIIGVEDKTGRIEEFRIEGDVEEVALMLERCNAGITLHNLG